MTTPGQEVLASLAQIIEEIASVPAAEILPEKSLVDDLHIDSLTMIEVAVAIQDKFDIDVPDEELKNLKTVGDVAALVQRTGVVT